LSGVRFSELLRIENYLGLLNLGADLIDFQTPAGINLQSQKNASLRIIRLMKHQEKK